MENSRYDEITSWQAAHYFAQSSSCVVELQEEGITELLMAPGKNGVPGSSGSRNLKDSLSDLKAQVAANQKGIQLVDDLIDEYGLKVVHAYMNYIQRNAATAVREMLKSFGKRKNLGSRGHVYAEEFMDDGTPLRLRVTVTDEGRATFDFTGTGPEVFGNCNAPPAVTYSAIIYALRCLVGEDIPLNQGCLEPIDIHIPDGTILKPSEKAAVVGHAGGPCHGPSFVNPPFPSVIGPHRLAAMC